jgi:streptomycin 6-kinase
VPGTPLVASAPWEVALEVLGQLTGRLHRAGAAPDGVVTRREQAPRWSALLAADPRAVAEQDLVDVLVGNARPGDDVLLHDDLHGGNALRAGAGDTWRVIDPHGVRGDRHGDVWAVLEPLAPALPTGPDAARRAATDRVHRYARAAGLDPARTASWVRLRARVVAADLRPPDDPELGAQDAAWVLRLHALADALRP